MLKGKNAIITGGVRGIGKAIAETFCKNGANVMLCYRNSKDAAEALKAELEKFGGKVILLQGNIADPAHAEEAAKKAKEEFGKIDILVNNAGITKDGLMMTMKNDDFDDVVKTNLNGSFYFTRDVSKIMIKQRVGKIINISSVVGVKGNPGQVNYSASKAGVIGMTLSASKELGKRNITVNAIAPGFIETDMTDALTEDQKANISKAISLGHVGKPEDVANTALFLASSMGDYITGQVIGVDGGLCI